MAEEEANAEAERERQARAAASTFAVVNARAAFAPSSLALDQPLPGALPDSYHAGAGGAGGPGGADNGDESDIECNPVETNLWDKAELDAIMKQMAVSVLTTAQRSRAHTKRRGAYISTFLGGGALFSALSDATSRLRSCLSHILTANCRTMTHRSLAPRLSPLKFKPLTPKTPKP